MEVDDVVYDAQQLDLLLQTYNRCGGFLLQCTSTTGLFCCGMSGFCLSYDVDVFCGRRVFSDHHRP